MDNHLKLILFPTYQNKEYILDNEFNRCYTNQSILNIYLNIGWLFKINYWGGYLRFMRYLSV